jgi:MoxR-like ATPase
MSLDESRLAQVAERCATVAHEIHRVFVGPRDVSELLLVSLLARGHVLLEGVPGVAKTTLAKTFATTLGCEFRRIQFTPDLLPADITGTYVLTPQDGAFHLRKGPVFANVVLADEINRAPAKTQSALLEAMQEAQTTIEGETFPLPAPFIVIATQNPVEQAGTYPLPEAQIDRFLLRLVIGYPTPSDERTIVRPTRSCHRPRSSPCNRWWRRCTSRTRSSTSWCGWRTTPVATLMSPWALHHGRRWPWCKPRRHARCVKGARSSCRTTSSVSRWWRGHIAWC